MKLCRGIKIEALWNGNSQVYDLDFVLLVKKLLIADKLSNPLLFPSIWSVWIESTKKKKNGLTERDESFAIIANHIVYKMIL